MVSVLMKSYHLGNSQYKSVKIYAVCSYSFLCISLQLAGGIYF